MSRYEFKSAVQFLKDQRENKLPKFIFYALNYGTLEVRGPETDKKVYKIYYRVLPGYTNKTRVLKELKPGMVLVDSGNGTPVISGVGYDVYYQKHSAKVEKESKPKVEIPKKMGRPRKNPETVVPKEPKKMGRPRKYPEVPKSDEPKKLGRPRKNPEVPKEPKRSPGRPRKNSEVVKDPKKDFEVFREKVMKDKPVKQKKTVVPSNNKEDNHYYTPDEVTIPLLNKSTRGGSKKMVPYKFISIEKLLKDLKSDDPAFEKLRIEYRKFNLRIVGKTLYTVYCGVFTTVDPTDYLVQQSNGRLAVLEESDVES